jgi:hypothetical protein
MPKVETGATKSQRKKGNREHAIQLLKTHLAITPKTANMLYDSGYTTPASLRNVTPNQATAKFAALPGMNVKKAKDYTRPMRRMVMLGDMEDTKEAAAAAKSCQKWSMKYLQTLGVWQEEFDDLTGQQIHEKLKGVYPPR